MKKNSTLLFCLMLFGACQKNIHPPRDPKFSEHAESPGKVKTAIDTTPRVTGVGGIFFFSKDPDKTKEWYGSHLGMAMDDYGSVFEYRNANSSDLTNYMRWSPFPEGSSYFKPSTKQFMINYRVHNLEGLLRNLKRNGVHILDSIQNYDYGKFVHIMDPEGNKIELWEPVDSVLTKLGGKTTK